MANNNGLLEVFCRYYNKKSNQYKTYDDFLLYIKKEYTNTEHITLRNIKSLGWNLIRNGILVSKKQNDTNGIFYTSRIINVNRLKEKLDIDITK